MSTRQHRVNYHRTRVASVNAMTAVSARGFPRHTHDQYGIGVIDGGGHASLSDAGEIAAGPGHLILVNPGEVHDGRPLDHRERAWRMLYFEPAMIDALQADVLQGGADPFALIAPVIDDRRIRGLFNRAFAQVVRGADDVADMAFDEATLEMLARLINALGRRRSIVAGSGADSIRRARDLIDADPSAPFTLARLAAGAGLSRFQLHRGFRREFGLPPHLYIVQRRAALARRLLKGGRPPVEAALAAGFCDQSHLNRVFTRTFGASPGRYR